MPTESAWRLHLLFQRCSINWTQSLVPHSPLQNAINPESTRVYSELGWPKMVFERDVLVQEMLKKGKALSEKS